MQIFIYCKVTLHVSGVTQHPSSGVLTTVTAASGTGHDTGTATFLQRGLIRPRWRQVAVPIYKYLHTVASGWIFITIASCSVLQLERNCGALDAFYALKTLQCYKRYIIFSITDFKPLLFMEFRVCMCSNFRLISDCSCLEHV